MKPQLRSHDPFAALETRISAPVGTVPATARSSVKMNEAEALSRLERHYPAIVQALTLLWGYPEMNEYFHKLWLSSEPVDPEAMADLMLLARVHQQLVPHRPLPQARSIYGRQYAGGAQGDAWEGVRPARRR